MKVYNTLEPGGGKMFKVVIDKNKILIYKILDNSQVYEIKNYKKIFIGKNSKNYGPSSKSHTGLSILVEIKEKEYVFISHKIQQFKTLEPIKKFYSQMGNNAFLYPFALTDNYAYLIIENKYIKRDFGDLDPYEVYYDFKKVWNRKSLKFSIKNIKYPTKLNGGGNTFSFRKNRVYPDNFSYYIIDNILYKSFNYIKNKLDSDKDINIIFIKLMPLNRNVTEIILKKDIHAFTPFNI
jgi:hypothetical protein